MICADWPNIIDKMNIHMDKLSTLRSHKKSEWVNIVAVEWYWTIIVNVIPNVTGVYTINLWVKEGRIAENLIYEVFISRYKRVYCTKIPSTEYTEDFELFILIGMVMLKLFFSNELLNLFDIYLLHLWGMFLWQWRMIDLKISFKI